MKENETNVDDKSKDDTEKPAALLIDDVVRYLSRLSTLNKDSKFGNIEFSKGLKKLSNALKPHAQMSILDIGAVIMKESPTDSLKGVDKKPKVELPEPVESLSDEKINEILNDSDYTKDQLIELGNRRYGIPKPKLKRLNKESVIESVNAAFDHEKSLGVISQEARRGGEKRSS